MATIGRAFAFYVKYWHIMEYEKEHRVVVLAKSLRSREREEAKKQIEAVRERANEQAAVLLGECGQAMKDHFVKLSCQVHRYTWERTILQDWYVLYKLANTGRGRKAWRLGGASIECLPSKKTPSILLGLRAPTVAGVEELEGVLGGCVCRGADLKGWNANWIFFAEVPIKLRGWANWKLLDLDGKHLVEETRKAMRKIDSKVVKTLLSL
jgi:hypothetical protein